MLSRGWQAQFNTLPYDERCEQSMRLLTDMEIMAHADYFVGGRSPMTCTSIACRSDMCMPPAASNYGSLGSCLLLLLARMAL